MGFYDSYSSRGPRKLRQNIQVRMYEGLFQKHGLTAIKQADFLEIGPGKGLFARYISETGVSYRCVEANEALGAALTEAGFNVVVQQAPPIPFPEASFDYVYHSHLIEHMKDSGTVYFLMEECLRVLKPGGQLIVLAPDYMRMGKYYWDCDYTHMFVVTKRRLNQVLTDAGFEIETLIRITEPFIGPIGFLADFLMLFFPYHFLENLCPFPKLRIILYKIRATFGPSLFVIARKRQ